MGYCFIVSKARDTAGRLLVLGSNILTRQGHRPVSLDLLRLSDASQMWERRPRASEPQSFGLHNRGFNLWMVRLNDGTGQLRPTLMPFSPEDPKFGRIARWFDDRVAGPYNALVSYDDWELKVNIAGDGPYGPDRGATRIIMWEWSGGATNELWRAWPVLTGAPAPGARILLTNFEHVKQLGATPEGAVYMHTNTQNWETWTVEDAGSGQCYLRSDHGTYLGSRQDGSVYVTRNREAWERWTLSFDDGIRVRSAQWGLHLGSRPDGSLYTHANRQSWERWWTPPA